MSKFLIIAYRVIIAPITNNIFKIKKKRIRVATKYPNLTQDFLFSKGVTQFRLVESLGATEAYPFTGSAELITDITSTGETLKANNLRILKDCLLYTSPSPRDLYRSRMPSSA